MSKKHDQIKTETIETDIRDTLIEITDMTREITKRRKFVKQLENILTERAKRKSINTNTEVNDDS